MCYVRAVGDTFDTIHKIGTSLVSIAIVGFAIYERVKKPTTPTVALTMTGAPHPPALLAADPAGAPHDFATQAALREVQSDLASVEASVASVVSSIAHEASRIDAIEAARATERLELREDQKEDRESRGRLSNSLALLHGKLDHQKGNGV